MSDPPLSDIEFKIKMDWLWTTLNFFLVLVDLLMKEHNLISRLKSVKRFFLLDQGDFLNQFIDLADDELKMPVSDITSSRLEALLEISIRTSAADKDPYKDDLKVVLSDKDLITQECYSQNNTFLGSRR